MRGWVNLGSCSIGLFYQQCTEFATIVPYGYFGPLDRMLAVYVTILLGVGAVRACRVASKA